MMMQLLQRGFNPGANPGGGKAPNPFDDAALLPILIVGGCLTVVVWSVIYGSFIFVLVRSMQALQAVRARNQAVAPGLVWLGLIPIFGSFWMFYVVGKTAESLADELDDRRLRTRVDDIKSTGTIYAVILAVCCVLSMATVIPFIGPVFGCVNFVLIIVQIIFAFIYSGKLQAVTKKLQRDGDYDDEPSPRRRSKRRADEEDDFEEYDDEPRPKKKPRPDDDFEEYDEPKGGR